MPTFPIHRSRRSVLFLALFALTASGGIPADAQQRNPQTRKFVSRKPTKTTPAKAVFKTVTLVDVGDFYKVGGDMLLDKKDPVHKAIIAALKNPNGRLPQLKPPVAKPRRQLDPPARNKKGIGSVQQPLTAAKGAFISKWPDGQVPYFYGSGFNNTERAAIERAMRTIEDVCGVHFFETSGFRPYRLRIKRSNDSNVGGTATVGRTFASTFHVNSTNQGTLIHELLHVLGFIHEHQRYDRDSFVTIQWSNIKDKYKHNYDKVPKNAGLAYLVGARESRPLTGYDFASIMHYAAFAPTFSIDRAKPNITRRDGRTFTPSSSLSRLDKEGLVHYYGASRKKIYLTEGEGFALGLHVKEIGTIGKGADAGVFGSNPDYYWILEIKDDVTYYNKWRSVHVDGKKTATHRDWKSWRYFDNSVYSAFPTIRCKLQVWDHDSGLRGKNDHCDLNPRKGQKDLSFTINMRTGRISGDISGSLGRDLVVTGGGDKYPVRMKFRLTRSSVSTSSTSNVGKHFHNAFKNGIVSLKRHNEMAWFAHRGGKGH